MAYSRILVGAGTNPVRCRIRSLLVAHAGIQRLSRKWISAHLPLRLQGSTAVSHDARSAKAAIAQAPVDGFDRLRYGDLSQVADIFMKYDFHFAKRQLLGVIFTRYNLVLYGRTGSLSSHGGGFPLLCPYFNGIPGCKCLTHHRRSASPRGRTPIGPQNGDKQNANLPSSRNRDNPLKIGASYLADLVHANHPLKSFPALQSQREGR
jgi:hypothetical protein